MKLLLDEHYSPLIANGLRERGHDSVTARETGYGGWDDEDLLTAAAEQDRALLTNNARHFVPIVRRWGAEGRAHAGLLLTSDVSMPRSEESIGMYVETLGALFHEHPGDSLRDLVLWVRSRHS